MAQKQSVVNLVRGHASMFREDFLEWLDLNFDIWLDFERRSLDVARFRSHYSARRLVESMRHDSAIREQGDGYKINGNYVPALSRLFMLAHPSLGGLFETRTASERRAA